VCPALRAAQLSLRLALPEFTRCSLCKRCWHPEPHEDETVDFTEHFWLVEDGHGHWIIRHQITDIVAGAILRTAGGFRLKNEHGRTIGNFPTIEASLAGLYERV